MPDEDETERRMREAEVERLQRNLFEECEPSALEIERREEALTYLLDHEDFGLPYEGGSLEQPRNWKRAVSFAMRARRDAEWERRKIEAEDARQPAEDY